MIQAFKFMEGFEHVGCMLICVGVQAHMEDSKQSNSPNEWTQTFGLGFAKSPLRGAILPKQELWAIADSHLGFRGSHSRRRLLGVWDLHLGQDGL